MTPTQKLIRNALFAVGWIFCLCLPYYPLFTGHYVHGGSLYASLPFHPAGYDFRAKAENSHRSDESFLAIGQLMGKVRIYEKKEKEILWMPYVMGGQPHPVEYSPLTWSDIFNETGKLLYHPLRFTAVFHPFFSHGFEQLMIFILTALGFLIFFLLEGLSFPLGAALSLVVTFQGQNFVWAASPIPEAFGLTALGLVALSCFRRFVVTRSWPRFVWLFAGLAQTLIYVESIYHMYANTAVVSALIILIASIVVIPWRKRAAWFLCLSIVLVIGFALSRIFPQFLSLLKIYMNTTLSSLDYSREPFNLKTLMSFLDPFFMGNIRGALIGTTNFYESNYFISYAGLALTLFGAAYGLKMRDKKILFLSGTLLFLFLIITVTPLRSALTSWNMLRVFKPTRLMLCIGTLSVLQIALLLGTDRRKEVLTRFPDFYRRLFKFFIAPIILLGVIYVFTKKFQRDRFELGFYIPLFLLVLMGGKHLLLSWILRKAPSTEKLALWLCLFMSVELTVHAAYLTPKLRKDLALPITQLDRLLLKETSDGSRIAPVDSWLIYPGMTPAIADLRSVAGYELTNEDGGRYQRAITEAIATRPGCDVFQNGVYSGFMTFNRKNQDCSHVSIVPGSLADLPFDEGAAFFDLFAVKFFLSLDPLNAQSTGPVSGVYLTPNSDALPPALFVSRAFDGTSSFPQAKLLAHLRSAKDSKIQLQSFSYSEADKISITAHNPSTTEHKTYFAFVTRYPERHTLTLNGSPLTCRRLELFLECPLTLHPGPNRFLIELNTTR